ncbi:hypothetical protein [Oscillatoria acuminata]|uniref:Lipoprotein n=1 Tax=Oscillatoria acuminata PCC 6304 TaxID=56110 RepID=K9TRE0_9CYAN|nr:hypothetical protein [Oscillatoria acuminata]AFY84963.1 hypothetical protein Oscil6304_5477 [Oscillatoria acuminata PCC 6304]
MKGHRFVKTVAILPWKRYAIASLVCALSLACTRTVNRQSTLTTANASDAEPNISYGELIFPQQSDYLIIPVGFQGDGKSSKSVFSQDVYRDSASDRMSLMTIYNLIFHNRRTGESHLLLSENTLISSFHLINEENEAGEPIKNQFVFLEVIPEDTNQDGNRDRQDAVIGYIADTSGKNLQQVTPDNTQLVFWQIDKPLGLLLMKVLQDSNNDRKFTGEDDISFIKVPLNKLGIGPDIITPEMRQQINQRVKL